MPGAFTRPFALAVLLASGCGRDGAAPGAGPAGPGLATPEPPSTLSAGAVAPPAAPDAAPPPPEPLRFTVTELAPTQGDLLPLLRAEADRARKKGLVAFVEFYADWCAPCRALHKSMIDARMIDAFRGTHIVKLNLDDWQDKLGGTGFTVPVIPAFFALDADGRPTGRRVDEKAWKKSVPEQMARPLKAFFQGMIEVVRSEA